MLSSGVSGHQLPQLFGKRGSVFIPLEAFGIALAQQFPQQLGLFFSGGRLNVFPAVDMWKPFACKGLRAFAGHII